MSDAANRGAQDARNTRQEEADTQRAGHAPQQRAAFPSALLLCVSQPDFSSPEQLQALPPVPPDDAAAAAAAQRALRQQRWMELQYGSAPGPREPAALSHNPLAPWANPLAPYYAPPPVAYSHPTYPSNVAALPPPGYAPREAPPPLAYSHLQYASNVASPPPPGFAPPDPDSPTPAPAPAPAPARSSLSNPLAGPRARFAARPSGDSGVSGGYNTGRSIHFAPLPPSNRRRSSTDYSSGYNSRNSNSGYNSGTSGTGSRNSGYRNRSATGARDDSPFTQTRRTRRRTLHRTTLPSIRTTTRPLCTRAASSRSLG